MESNSAICFRRKHKKFKAKEGEEDTLSSKLPESLISRILSLLPTKEAVRTSVLSKRWVHRWTSLTSLNLQDSVFYSPNRKFGGKNLNLHDSVFYSPNRKSGGKKKTGGKLHFINFVNRALALTNGSALESFSLLIGDKYDVSVLNTWISSILIRGVKNLCISTDSKLPLSALTSYYLFESDSFEVLVLEMYCSPIKVPPCSTGVWFVFHKLKLLKLCGIICTFDSSLRLYLPNLKKFETKNCSWVSARERSVIVNAPLLESIFIEHDFESVSREPRSCTIDFSATQLKEFSYSGDGGISQNIILLSPLSACNASVNIILKQFRNSTVPETGSCAFLLLKQFSQVKCIKFDGSKVLTQPNVTVLPVFAMLSHLELHLVTGEILLGLLQKSPVLKTLVLKGISKFDQELLNSCVVPECLTFTLEIVKFENVKGYEHELYLAKLFLEKGTVLERMSFSLLGGWGGKSKVMEEFKEKLFSFKKGFSSFAIVEFSYNYDDDDLFEAY